MKASAPSAWQIFVGLMVVPRLVERERHHKRTSSYISRNGSRRPATIAGCTPTQCSTSRSLTQRTSSYNSRATTVEPRTSTDPEVVDSGDPASLRGIEFIEYATARPLALGHVLELMGFRPVARHRSREVLLYRQGSMNVVINAHAAQRHGHPVDDARIAAVAFRARDAAAAYRRALDRGAWAVPTHVEVMELNIPAIHGVGASRIYFVDRYREFSIYAVDFVPMPGANP